ncbi:MAG: NUDIX domain-containing protein [Deltaproteobacteria bacterium]|nr:NUDIX domain-containing protein [Deltaproteobacteria bacterium]
MAGQADPRVADALARIAAFEATEPETVEARRAVLGLLGAAGGRAFDRRCFDPGHLTASALVLPPGGGAILLVHHARLGRWLQPGGHVEPQDPDLLATARREVEEETGIRASLLARSVLDIDVHRIPASANEPAHRHFDVRFVLVAPTRHVHAGDGVRAVRWVGLSDLPSAGIDGSILRAAVRIPASAGV